MRKGLGVKSYCALCGRPMIQAAVLIGNYPVGPKCARRAGLLPLAKRKSGLVFEVPRKTTSQSSCPMTPDLFDEAPA